MKRIVAIIVSVCLLSSGCASLQGVPLPRAANERADVKVGERVEVTTRQGKTERFRVTEVTDEALEGEGVRVAYTDMTSLQVNRADSAQTGATLWVIGGILLAGLAAYFIANGDEIGAAASTR